MAVPRHFGSNSFLKTHGMPAKNQSLSQEVLDEGIYRGTGTLVTPVDTECAIGIKAIKHLTFLNELYAHFFLGNFEFTLKYKENNHATAKVALTWQNNLLTSLILLIEAITDCPQLLTQPVAWHLKRLLQASFVTDLPDSTTAHLKNISKPLVPKIFSLMPEPDHGSHCSTCGPLPELEKD